MPEIPSDLKERIEDEVIRSEIANALSEKDKPTPLSKRLAHPLLLTLAGFVLTAGVGTLIEYRVSQSQAAQAAQQDALSAARADELAAREQMMHLVDLLQTRTVRARLLRSAILRQSATEIEERKADYDDAYFEWNRQLSATSVGLRQHIFDADNRPVPGQNLYEEQIVTGLRIALARSDSCLTRVYDVYNVEPQYVPTYDCNGVHWARYVRENLIHAESCINAIMTDAIFYFRARADARHAVALSPGADAVFPEISEAAIAAVCRISDHTDLEDQQENGGRPVADLGADGDVLVETLVESRPP